MAKPRNERMAQTLETLFAKTAPEPNTGCWLWLGGVAGGTGYGVVWHRGKALGAHRLAYELANGSVPAGMDVCHKCDVRICINPGHLFAATHAENMMDMRAKGRANTARGERHARAGLTEQQVLEIRAAFTGGERQMDIAKRHGITGLNVHQIVRRRSWRHID